MKLSLSNGIFSKFDLEENFAEIKRLGFENIEFNMKSVKVEDDVSVYTAKNLAEKYGIKCASLHAATLYVKDEVEIHRAIYYWKISLVFARILSAPIMVIHSNVSRKIPAEQRGKILKSVFKEVGLHAENYGVRLALENLSYASSGYGKNVVELEEVFGVLDEGKNGTVGLTLDLSHATASGTTFSLLEKYHNRLCNIHLSGRAHKGFTYEDDNLVAVLSKLKEYNYNGLVTLELNRKSKIEDILKTKAVIESALKKSIPHLEK
jgi:sugar phosphate isomerase/epimerase